MFFVLVGKSFSLSAVSTFYEPIIPYRYQTTKQLLRNKTAPEKIINYIIVLWIFITLLHVTCSFMYSEHSIYAFFVFEAELVPSSVLGWIKGRTHKTARLQLGLWGL